MSLRVKSVALCNCEGVVKNPPGSPQLQAAVNSFQELMDTSSLTIKGGYRETFDVIRVDNQIKKWFKERKSLLPVLREMLTATRNRMDSEFLQTSLQREIDLSECALITSCIAEIETGSLFSEYQRDTKNLVDRYNKGNVCIRTVVFGKDGTDVETTNPEKTLIVDEYISLASKYVRIDVTRMNLIKSDLCSNCGNNLEDMVAQPDSQLVCDCGAIQRKLVYNKFSKDENKFESHEDESIENFEKAFYDYMGICTNRIPPVLYKELDDYFSSKKMPIGKDVMLLPLERNGRRGNTNAKMLRNALSQIGRPAFYKNVNHIGSMYFGWNLPDISHHREKVMQYYNELQKAFRSIPLQERQRKSSLGTQLMLQELLIMVGHECYPDEFKVSENPESIRLQYKLFKRMCESCNNPSIRCRF